MVTFIDKRQRADLFRDRLSRSMQEKGLNQSSLARAIRVDRSTVSQLLNDDSTRLPNAHVVGACASALGVSSDWLLGLTDRPERAADVLGASVMTTTAPRALIDEQIFSWHELAAGYKICHVPAGLPDMLKTPEMLRWEYSAHLGKSVDQAIGAATDRLDWMRECRSDYEIAVPLHEVTALAFAEGYYRDLDRDLRLGQMQNFLDLYELLYPSLRITLFDAHKLWSAPITIFGPQMAVLYLGRHYLVFRDREKVQDIRDHFDWLIRQTEISDREFPEHIAKLMATI